MLSLRFGHIQCLSIHYLSLLLSLNLKRHVEVIWVSGCIVKRRKAEHLSVRSFRREFSTRWWKRTECKVLLHDFWREIWIPASERGSREAARGQGGRGEWGLSPSFNTFNLDAPHSYFPFILLHFGAFNHLSPSFSREASVNRTLTPNPLYYVQV